MNKESFVAIVNPAAGGGRFVTQAAQAIAELRRAGVCVDVSETTRVGEATELAFKAYADGYRNFISVGGDGTGFELLNGLLPHSFCAQERCTLGFIPMGTGNSFLRDITNDGAAYSIQAIARQSKKPCDVLRLTHKEGVLHFINICSMGFVSKVARLRNRFFPKLGEAGYVLATGIGMISLQSYEIPISVDEGPWEQDPVLFLSINNSRCTGGKMMMAPAASIEDGLADLVLVRPMKRLELLRTFPKIFDGSHVHLEKVEVRTFRTLQFGVSSTLDVMMDGEMENVWPMKLDVLPNALEVFA